MKSARRLPRPERRVLKSAAYSARPPASVSLRDQNPMLNQSDYSPIPPGPRSDYCGLLRAADAGREVALWGWVATRRDHGGVIFIDLRDRAGLVQLVFHPESDAGAHTVAATARGEFYIAAKGKVVRRSEGTINRE